MGLATMSRTDTRQHLLSLCKLYRGEANNPYNHDAPNAQMFWRCEEFWANATLRQDDDSLLAAMVDDYLEAGLKDFAATDQTPITLKAVLFNRFCKYNERADIEAFKRLYLEEYIKP